MKKKEMEWVERPNNQGFYLKEKDNQPERSKREDFEDEILYECGCRKAPGEWGLHQDCENLEHINFKL